MEVVLAGASGLIGSALASALRDDGHRVKQLVRRAPAPAPDTDTWDPAAGRLDPDFLAGADAVVCLSGATVGRRWTESYKRKIESSRVDTVGTIARHLAEYGGPRVFVAASAIGYYGDAGDREVDESAPPGGSFLAGVCRRWEAAADPARAAGVRVVHLRSGLVLSGRGGLLKPLSLVVKAGLGGRLGAGQQFMAWISLTDEVRAIRYLLDSDIDGAVNLTAPHPVRNSEFTETLGHVLHRPTVLPVPAFATRIALGELAGEVLGGQRAVPRRLADSGFEFRHGELEAALRAELG